MGAQADAIEAALIATVEKAAKALVLAIVANLVATTPVRTGWARANWIPSIGVPVDAAAGSPQAVENGEQQAGIAKVLSYRLAGGTLWISNNVPYISILNYGSSTQAPAGFVERAIDEALLQVERDFGIDFGIAQFRQDVGAAGAENLAEAYSPFGGAS